MNADFSDTNNWILLLAKNIIKHFSHLPNVQSFVAPKLQQAMSTNQTKTDYYELQDMPSLVILSYCTASMSNHHLMEPNNLLMLFIKMRLNPNLNKTHYNLLHTVQFESILAILSAKNTTINQDNARKAIQYAVDCLDIAKSETKCIILQCISFLLPFANLSSSNLKILSDAAWHGMLYHFIHITNFYLP